MQDALEILGIGCHPVPCAAVAAESVHAREHERLRADALGEGRKFSLVHQLGEEGRFILRPPRGSRALGIIDVPPDDLGMGGVKAGGAGALRGGGFGGRRHGRAVGEVRAEKRRGREDEPRENDRDRRQAGQEFGGEDQAALKAGHGL